MPGAAVPGLGVEEAGPPHGTAAAPDGPRPHHHRVRPGPANRGDAVVEPEAAVTAEGLFGRTLPDRPDPPGGRGGRGGLSQPWPDAPQAERGAVRPRAESAAHPGLPAGGAAPASRRSRGPPSAASPARGRGGRPPPEPVPRSPPAPALRRGQWLRGKPRSTPVWPSDGSGQRVVTTLPRV
ncbi:hypothetical protein GCM10009731_16550 [Streptomyces globosus]